MPVSIGVQGDPRELPLERIDCPIEQVGNIRTRAASCRRAGSPRTLRLLAAVSIRAPHVKGHCDERASPPARSSTNQEKSMKIKTSRTVMIGFMYF